MKMFWRLILACALASPAQARTLEGVQMPEQVELADSQLTLNGMGLRKKVLFKVYVAGLYLEQPSDDSQQIIQSDQIKHVELMMLRDLDAKQVADTIRQGFEKNSRAQMPQLEQRLSQLTGAIQDVKKGEVLSVTYIPGEGTRLQSGGKLLTVVEGEDFGQALFKVWLGADPVDQGLKEDLLGQ